MIDTKRLRQKILDLAIRGKLVPQDPDDEPASILLERIREEKLQMVAEGKLKKKDIAKDSVIFFGDDNCPYEKVGDGEPVCIAEEVPFELPVGWEWARLENFAMVFNGDRGKNYPAKSKLGHTGIPFVSALNISNGIVSEEKMLYMTDEQYEALGAGQLNLNDIVFCIRGSLGKCGVFPFEKGAIASSLVIVRQVLNDSVVSPYILYLFQSDLTYWHMSHFDNGTAQPNLAAKDLKSFLYPIPPLAEQQRIVAALDKYLALVDEIERNQEELESLLAKARSKVLDLAIRGKLVPQDPNDEPASVLLERIREEKLQMVAEGKLKKKDIARDSVIYKGEDNSYYEKVGDGEPVCIADEVPFELPARWEWSRLDGVFAHNTGKALNSKNKDGRLFTYITTSNMYWNKFILDNLQEMRFTDEELEKCTVTRGDLLVCEGGDIGRSAIWSYDYPMRIQNHIHRLRSYSEMSHPFFYHVFLYYKLSNRLSGKGIGIQGLSSKALGNIVLPIPPVAEQVRLADVLTKMLDSLYFE